jgi:hypothetical protein
VNFAVSYADPNYPVVFVENYSGPVLGKVLVAFAHANVHEMDWTWSRKSHALTGAATEPPA